MYKAAFELEGGLRDRNKRAAHGGQKKKEEEEEKAGGKEENGTIEKDQ